MSAKPRGLGPQYGAQFGDASIVRAYRHRPPYPPEVFRVLAGLVGDSSTDALELGCGGGELSIGLSDIVGHLDAVDLSARMLEAARRRPGGDSPKIRWIQSGAESFESARSYGLVVAASSFHWFDWDVVMPKLQRWLLPGGYLALVEGPDFSPVPWDGELSRLIVKHSTNTDFEPFDLVRELGSRGFVVVGRHRTEPVPFEQSIADHVELMHSRNGFSRDRMVESSAHAFDAAYRALLGAHCPDGVVRTCVVSDVCWGVLASP